MIILVITGVVGIVTNDLKKFWKPFLENTESTAVSN
jgi:hypothetical protein